MQAHHLQTMLVAVLVASSGCGGEPQGAARGRRVTVSETVGDTHRRVVRVAATVVDGSGGSRHLRDVTVDIEPGDDSLTTKLEAVLDDTVLAAGAWPEPIGVLPRETEPALARLQLALAVLDGPPEVLHSRLALFHAPPSASLTSITRVADRVDVRVLALVAAPEGGSVAHGWVTGVRTERGASLEGARRSSGGEEERVSIQIEASHAGG